MARESIHRNHLTRGWSLSAKIRHYSSEPNARGCVLWTAAKNTRGYGVLLHQGKIHLAHRLAWLDANGPVPPGLCVLHHCDTKDCVNVAHLFLGTNLDNTTDMMRKGRGVQVCGEACGTSTLSESEVRAIRAADGLMREIGERFGVSARHVGAIKARKSWAWLE